MQSNWLNIRSEFNHDWLKPKYLNAAQSFLDRLASNDSSERPIREFLQVDFPEWGSRSAEAWQIIQHFESEMSPATLFKSVVPQYKCNRYDNGWFFEIIHALWLERANVRQLVTDASIQLRKVDQGFAKISERLSSYADHTVQCLKTDRHVWQMFVDDCRQFSRCLSKFPSKVELV